MSLKKNILTSSIVLLLTGHLTPILATSVQASEKDSGYQNIETINNKYEQVDSTTLLDKDTSILYGFDSTDSMTEFLQPNSSSLKAITPFAAYQPKWQIMTFVYFSKSELKQLAQVAKKNQGYAGFMTLLGAWTYKFPAVGASITTLASLMYSNQQAIINAANANKKATMYYEKNVNWNGYGAQTRTRMVYHN